MHRRLLLRHERRPAFGFFFLSNDCAPRASDFNRDVDEATPTTIHRGSCCHCRSTVRAVRGVCVRLPDVRLPCAASRSTFASFHSWQELSTRSSQSPSAPRIAVARQTCGRAPLVSSSVLSGCGAHRRERRRRRRSGESCSAEWSVGASPTNSRALSAASQTLGESSATFRAALINYLAVSYCMRSRRRDGEVP